MRGVSLVTLPMLSSILCKLFLIFFICVVSLLHPILVSSFFSFFFFKIWGASLTHLMLVSFLSAEFLLHIPRWLNFYAGSFSYTSHGGFIFIWRVSLTHLKQALCFCGEFLIHIPCWLLFLICRVSLTHPVLASFVILGVTLTHPILALFLSGEFLLHIPCWLYFSVGSFSFTSCTGFFF